MRFKEFRAACTLDSILVHFWRSRIAVGAAQLKCHDTSKSSEAGAFAIYTGKRTMAKIRVRVSDRSLIRTRSAAINYLQKQRALVCGTWVLEFRAGNKPGVHFARSYVAICVSQRNTRSFIWICVGSCGQVVCLLWQVNFPLAHSFWRINFRYSREMHG